MEITLRAARVNAGLTQAEVERRTGFARSTIISWERARTSPRAKDLATLCQLYGVSAGNIKLK